LSRATVRAGNATGEESESYEQISTMSTKKRRKNEPFINPERIDPAWSAHRAEFGIAL